ncbi:class I SAM-dependent methyltransferase [Providencia alcalifaciens]|uniref:class I SAM-dependent methyltransferase n=1 Tax=Providencia alcalifaciens TaxID=126385 RepID=UPI001CC6DF0A|nr:class I SAM-dependent methyltransferase [Providencia alcalifaciens]CAG9408543.1 hypothetical protein NVI2019_GHJFPKLH_00365 [Providencia alcalifaciens]
MLRKYQLLNEKESIENLNTLPDSPFDDLPEFYHQSLHWPYRQYLEIPTIKNLLGNLTGRTVLDFGCGPGSLSREFKAMGAKEVMGYDISKGMLNYARQQEKNAPLDIEYLSYIPLCYQQYFDVVIAIYPMVCMKDRYELESMIFHISSLLKCGGKLITLVLNTELNNTPNFYQPYGFNLFDESPRKDGSITRIQLGHFPEEKSFPICYWFTETLNKIFRSAGLDEAKKEILIPPPLKHLDHLQNYISYPHVDILTTIKK